MPLWNFCIRLKAQFPIKSCMSYDGPLRIDCITNLDFCVSDLRCKIFSIKINNYDELTFSFRKTIFNRNLNPIIFEQKSFMILNLVENVNFS